LLAAGILGGQDRIRAAFKLGNPQPTVDGKPAADPRWLTVPIFAVAVYGGYFGAGAGIMMLAVLGLVLHGELKELNGLKQVLLFVTNVTAAVFFLGSGKVRWSLAGVMAVTSLVGGHLGGSIAGKLDAKRLRAVVVTIGVLVAIWYFFK
jgi:uncharacterized membrane protein YfcA